jgi:hypothetical protein
MRYTVILINHSSTGHAEAGLGRKANCKSRLESETLSYNQNIPIPTKILQESTAVVTKAEDTSSQRPHETAQGTQLPNMLRSR